MSHGKEGSSYTIAFATTAMSTTNPTNAFPFVAGSDTRVKIESINIGFVGATASNFGVKIFRGSTTALSSAAAVTPRPLGGWSGHASASSYATAPTTTLASTTSAALIDAHSSEDGFSYEFEGCGLVLIPNQRLDVVMTVPGAATVYGTMVFREIGKNPVS